MKGYVVDASVILKWVLGDEREEDQDKARELLNAWVDGRVDLSVPKLWQYEVGNFLGREIPEYATEKMKLLLSLGIKSVHLNEDMCFQCLTWMQKNRVTFYDASYLAVAYEIKGTLITADERFIKKMGEIDRICLLKHLDI